MKKAIIAFVIAVAAFVLPGGSAGAKMRIYGHWVVNSQRDRFEDGRLRIIAMVPSEEGERFGMGLRCLGKSISLVLSGSFHAGDIYVVEFRADRHPIIVTAGTGLSDQVMQVEMVGDMHKQILAADEYAFRITGEVSYQIYFRAAPGADMALPLVEEACVK